ncbi:hypothetical protein ACFSC6_00100 [Rufibacter sediminis]|uniref:hypothetical protein n=1 Tax=Rufibacter sediminis TaxID=2762756 RepID=UPI00210D0646|nr:hypothetical protein [Rufibacter sediminis]
MELNSALTNKFDVSGDYARKLVQRAVEDGVLHSSHPITFGKNQYVYLRPGELLTLPRIKEITQKYRPPVYRLLEAMDLNEGIISYYEGLKVTASPLKASSTKADSLDEIFGYLKRQGFVKERTDRSGIRYILYDSPSLENEEEMELMNYHRARMVTDCIFLPDIMRWLRRVNIVDNHKVIYRNKTTPAIGANQNNLVWDAYAYTKTTGLNPVLAAKANAIDKMTLVAIDVVIARPYSQVDLDGFLSRIQINLHSVSEGTRKVIPIIVYKEIPELVLNRSRALGFMSFDLGSIFGTNIYSVIERLNLIKVNDLTLKDDALTASVEGTLDLIRNSGQEDSLRDLRGVLFEYLLYPLVRTLYGNAQIEQGKTLSMTKQDGSKEYYEYDFIIKSSTPKEILIIELKGYSSTSRIPIGDHNTHNTLRWFFRRTLPFAAKVLDKEVKDSGSVIKGCFITSASFFDDGKEFLDKMNQSGHKPKNLDSYYDGDGLINLLKGNDFIKIKQIIEKFYIKSDIKDQI